MRYLLLILFGISTFLAKAQEAPFVKGQLLIQLKHNTNSNQFIRKFQTEQHISVRSFKCISAPLNIYLIEFEDKAINLNQSKRFIYSYNEVQLVQKNHLVASREAIPNDILFNDQWYLKNTGTGGGVVDADIDATDAWDITTGGTTTHNDTIVVCVIEGSGVDISHEDLQGNLWKNYAEIPGDGIDNDNNGYIDDFRGWNVQSEDDFVASGSHGTRVCGMIGAKGNNEIGISGVNWDVKMMIIKGQTASNEASVIAAYTYPLVMRKRYNESYGEEGAFVVATNASWGIDNGNPADSPLWCAIYDSLGVHGILNVGATTNNNVNVDVAGDLPTGCTSPYFIGVTMSNNIDVRASSGFGTTAVDLAAPGYGVKLPIPGNSYSTTNGTSFATPCVTGAIALAYAAPCADFINLAKFDPAAATLQMKDYILNGVDVLPALSTDVMTSGRLNVFNSINLMLDGCDTDACIPPYNLRANAISDTAATLHWDGFTTDYLLTINGTEIAVVGNEINLDTLSPCSEYTFSLKANCGEGDISVSSFDFTFETDGCCKNPPLSNSGKTENSLDISWAEIAYATQYNVRYAKDGTEDWTTLTDVSSPITLNDLEKCTKYAFQINTICTDSTRGYSTSYVFRTLGCGPCTEAEYCTPLTGSTNYEWINSFSLNGSTITSGNNDGYHVGTRIVAALTPSESYTMKITPGYSNTAFTEHYSVYIDFNQNGIFEELTERVMFNQTESGIITRSIDIPATALIGVTKMRIGMQTYFNPIPCPTTTYYGEYEDHCVYIGPPSGIADLENEISIYPNPVYNELHIKSSEEIEEIKIFRTDGKLIYQNHDYNGEAIPFFDFSNGVYIIQLETVGTTVTKKFVKNS